MAEELEATERHIPVGIEKEMKSSYIDYSMSVIVSRALPDVRDGLKPVHRRVLYGMHELGVSFGRPYKKCARIVGEVMGKYHPHGDASIYDTMVRLAQPWSMRYMLVNGQGNFGSVDGDSAASFRYTEAKMQRISEDMLLDIDKNTVPYRLNFDDSLEEPEVLPTRVPNLLINGASGIAVGMATNMPPHNLREVVDVIVAYLENTDIEVSEMMEYIKAPDFPTGGIVYGYEGVKEAFQTGRGRIVLRGRADIKEVDGRFHIIVTEIPYQVNKADMIKKTADLIEEKKIEGITSIRDESDRSGMRIVYILKRDAMPENVLNSLYKYTALQSSFSVNNIALVNGRPELLNLRQLVVHFVKHRLEVVVRRTQFDLEKAENRAHILEGLIIASDHIDEVITLIRASNSVEAARDGLMARFGLTEPQSKAIVEMRLRQLTGLEQDKLRSEYDDVKALIEKLKYILSSQDRRIEIVKEELLDIKERYGDDRRTEIDFLGGEFSVEDFIPDEQVLITISHAGYIKRTPLVEYKTQTRGGVGQRGVVTRDEDFLRDVFVASNHLYLLFFTKKGKCYWLRVYEVPEGSKISKGRALQNLINLEQDDYVRAFICLRDLKDQDYINSHYVVMATKLGVVKKTLLEQYSRPRKNGINAITIREGDELIDSRITNGTSHVMLASRLGKVIRFEEAGIRSVGRSSQGVRGITLAGKEDYVVGMVVPGEEEDILVVTEGGYGKRSELSEYRITNRGGKGVKTVSITPKTGPLVAIQGVRKEEDLMIINKSGIAIRMKVLDIRVTGRATQGVRVINIKGRDAIASITKVVSDDGEQNDTVNMDEGV